MNIKDFIKQNGLKMKATPHYENPHLEDADPSMSHWKCVIKRGDAKMGIYFSMGSAIKGPPKLEEVLDCLASDASGYENCHGDFDSWCGEYGYDDDSRKAHKTFRLVGRQAEKLKALLGDTLYDELLWHTERC